MNPYDLMIMRVLAARVEQLESGNMHLQVDNQGLQSENQRLQVMLEEAQKRIADLEAEKPEDADEHPAAS